MYRIIIILFVIAISTIVSGQNIENKKAVRPPSIIKAPIVTTFPKASDKRDENEKYWIVYSDRDNNSYFSDASLTPGKEIGKLEFLDACYVSEEKEEVVKVVRHEFEPFPIETSGKVATFVKTAKELGWISKKKLLLWKNSLIDPETNYTEKAVTVTKLKELANVKAYFRDGLIDLYKKPNIESNARSEEELKMFEYLFIYKHENNMLLIGKNNNVRPGDVNTIIVGWTPENQVYKWKNALCLRVNFDQNEEEARRKAQIPVGFFDSPETAKKYRNGDKVIPLPYEYKDPTIEANQKDNPYLLGYPILNSDKDLENGIYRTGYITNTLNENGSSIFDVLDQAEMDEKNAKGENEFEKVYIFFAFDGSRRDILKTVADAINANTELNNENKNSTNKYYWNAIIYNQSDCNPEVEFLESSFTDDKEEFEQKLISFSLKDKPEGCVINRDENGSTVFKAITDACNRFPKPTNSNILIITGTTADKNRGLMADAQKAMNTKNVNTFFIQLQNKNNSAYDNFIIDIKNLVFNVNLSIDNDELKGFTGKEFGKVTWRQEKDAFHLINTSRLGTFYSKDDQVFTSKEMKNYLGDFLRKNNKYINDIKSMYKNTNKELAKTLTPANKEDQSVKKGFYYFLKNNNHLTDSEIVKMNNQKNYQLFIEAYTTYTHRSLKEPFFNKSLFLSYSEFNRLMKSLEDLSNNANSTEERRLKIINSYKSIIQNYKGGYFNDKDNSMSIEEFWKLMSGMPSNNPLFSKYTLSSIQNGNKVGKEDIDKISNGFNQIYKRLKNVKSGKDYSKIEIGDNEFYWVTEKDFEFN